jgi:hypothetical protein
MIYDVIYDMIYDMSEILNLYTCIYIYIYILFMCILFCVYTVIGGIASISSGELVSIDYDEPTSTLYTTTAGDKMIRMWDLTILKTTLK